jgi:Baseplate J-like protein
MKDKTCTCCAGIHKSSPAQIANRPGLFALNYRVGTHATFVETMKARLSNFYLEDSEPQGQRLPERIYPLSQLATRESDDPAIAMLDAWATVADVLTFYQERIANEGYLRTATERRSVLELARLVGYNLRPGVAASTYLAYTLEKDSIVTIPAGSRAQSVPGPGETMQAFETSVDLPARTEWNALKPRTTRPQSPDENMKVAGRALYFKGITTNLKANDAILVDFGGAARGQALYRVMEVLPDAGADRTKVSLQPWAQPPTKGMEGVLSKARTATIGSPALDSFADAQRAQPRASVEKVEKIVNHYGDKERFGDLLKTRTGSKVLEQLEVLVTGSPANSDVELASLINEKALPALEDALRSAREGRFTRLEPWIQEVIRELEDAVESAPANPPGAMHHAAAENASFFDASSFSVSTSSAAAYAPYVPDKPAASVEKDIEYLLQSLEKPASIPPANPSQLERDIKRAFSPNSDIAPNLLTTIRPGLAPLLLKALGNRPVPQPTTAKVYAMRTRASVFGHNAPLKPIMDDENKGQIKGYEEWTLTRFGEAGKEDFELALQFLIRRGKPQGSPDDDDDFGSPSQSEARPRFMFRTGIRIGSFQPIIHPSQTPGEPLSPHNFEINYPAAGETPISVSVEVLPGRSTPGGVPPFIITFQFKQRPIRIKIDFSKPVLSHDVDPTVTSTGIDPSTFTVSISRDLSSIKGEGFPIRNESVVNAGVMLSVTGRALSSQKQTTEKSNIVSLDTSYPQVVPSVPGATESWVAIERADPSRQTPLVIISRVLQVKEASRADYGLAVKGTRLTLDKPWLNPVPDGQGKPTEEIDPTQNTFEYIRGTTVFAQSEELKLAEAPVDPLAYPLCGSEIELDGFYSGLEAGRWLIVTGERADITPTAPKPNVKEGDGVAPAVVKQFPIVKREHDMSIAYAQYVEAEDAAKERVKPPVIGGLKSTELVMLAGLRHNNPPGDKFSTTLLLANPLAYCYKLDTVTIYANVAHATHGETRGEVLGSGDASQPLQTFTLRQPPLTFVSAPTASGTDTTLKVRVNDVLWHETESLAELGAKDRRYLTRTDDEGKTRVIFGNGEKGARPATGVENITAIYRNGIGRAGNVKAEQISMLATKPLGVKEVINPLPATGGADKEDRDTARRNAPLAVMSLDRLVSVRDYEDFTRTFAGIGKASAVRLSDGRRQIVFLTIAGADDIPIAETSDLYQNLRRALHLFGDPFQAVQVKRRRLKLLVASAGVRVHPDYLWEKVEPQVRAALFDKFSFKRRELGQDALLSEVTSAMQSVEGVLYVDVDLFGAVDEDITSVDLTQRLSSFARNVEKGRVVSEMAQINEKETDPDKRIRPAELAIMSPAVADTLILKELKA